MIVVIDRQAHIDRFLLNDLHSSVNTRINQSISRLTRENDGRARCLSARLSVRPSVRPSVCLSVCLSICVYLYSCLSVCFCCHQLHLPQWSMKNIGMPTVFSHSIERRQSCYFSRALICNQNKYVHYSSFIHLFSSSQNDLTSTHRLNISRSPAEIIWTRLFRVHLWWSYLVTMTDVLTFACRKEWEIMKTYNSNKSYGCVLSFRVVCRHSTHRGREREKQRTEPVDMNGLRCIVIHSVCLFCGMLSIKGIGMCSHTYTHTHTCIQMIIWDRCSHQTDILLPMDKSTFRCQRIFQSNMRSKVRRGKKKKDEISYLVRIERKENYWEWLIDRKREWTLTCHEKEQEEEDDDDNDEHCLLIICVRSSLSSYKTIVCTRVLGQWSMY
jgi:hypothetical protein